MEFLDRPCYDLSMPVLHLIVVLLVLALVCAVYGRYVKPHVPEPFNTGIIIVAALAFCYWLLSLINLVPPLRW